MAKVDRSLVKLYVPKSVRILQPTAVSQYQGYIQVALKELEPKVLRLAEDNTPLGESFELVSSIKIDTVPGVMKVEWTSPYASAVEKGSRPHWAPIARIAAWVAYKLNGDMELAYKIRASIHKKGTKPARFFREARSAIYHYAVPAFRERMKLLAKLLSGDFGP